MNKTGDEIELDVFNIITNSQLAKEIKGNVYREGTRDLNPMEEDIIVSFLTGLIISPVSSSCAAKAFARMLSRVLYKK